VLSAAFLHERLTAAKIGALGLALAGMALTVAPALPAGAMAAQPAGVAFGIAAAAIYAVYIIAGTRIGKRVSPLAMSTVVIGSAAAVFVVVASIRGPQWPQSAAGWLAIVAIALVSTVLAITLFFAGLERIGPTRASTLSTIEPVVTVTLAAIVLDETIQPVRLTGGVLILVAVIVLARGGRSAQDREAARSMQA
jgi:drug/metabolite transporter (DMT)-like permease